MGQFSAIRNRRPSQNSSAEFPDPGVSGGPSSVCWKADGARRSACESGVRSKARAFPGSPAGSIDERSGEWSRHRRRSSERRATGNPYATGERCRTGCVGHRPAAGPSGERGRTVRGYARRCARPAPPDRRLWKASVVRSSGRLRTTSITPMIEHPASRYGPVRGIAHPIGLPRAASVASVEIN